MMPLEWLGRTELFEGLEETKLQGLLLGSKIRDYGQGEIVFHQGEEAKDLYLLIQGAIDLTVKSEGEADMMASRIEKEGAVFGTASLMEPFRYNVSALCLKPSRVLVLDALWIRKRMEGDPEMGMRLMKRLAAIYFNRLNTLRRGVANILQSLNLKPV